MFDIIFYKKIFDLKSRLMKGERLNKKYVIDSIEGLRSKYPVIYNLETTNACNMRCKMCPRTTRMTRTITTMDMMTFEKIIDQIKPFSENTWQDWEDFVEKNYGIIKNDMSENHFFLYIIPKVLVMHGYGDPLLDRLMPQRIRLLTDRGIPSYFSCNPANIDIQKTTEMFENGLDYIKFSIESVDDMHHKEIRGNASNFTDSYRKIIELINIKNQRNLKTTIVITMLNLNTTWQKEEFQKLQGTFRELNCYVYLKSQDQQWYLDNKQKTKSFHWIEFCQFPWSSMTIKSNGEAAMCVEDFNNEIILGDAKNESLYDIWNGEKYSRFREDHFKLTHGIKCTEQCDMKLLGSLIQ
ncbi:MAG TPA: SPASM domain-containing protein [Candidatus Methylomirabilis sp.]|nr:SPASM domain-containing protein [Candidatus Methylomirabilis sp.]